MLKLQSKEVKTAFKRLKPCISNDDSRYYLCGIYIVFDGKNLVFVATDGLRLGENFIDFEGAIEPFKVIVHKQTIKALIKLLPSEGEIDLVFEDGKLSFFFNDLYHKAQLIDGRFPDWEKAKVDPAEFTKVSYMKKYLRDLIKATKDAESQCLTIHVKDHNTAAVIKVPGEDKLTYLLMPSRC